MKDEFVRNQFEFHSPFEKRHLFLIFTDHIYSHTDVFKNHTYLTNNTNMSLCVTHLLLDGTLNIEPKVGKCLDYWPSWAAVVQSSWGWSMMMPRNQKKPSQYILHYENTNHYLISIIHRGYFFSFHWWILDQLNKLLLFRTKLIAELAKS